MRIFTLSSSFSAENRNITERTIDNVCNSLLYKIDRTYFIICISKSNISFVKYTIIINYIILNWNIKLSLRYFNKTFHRRILKQNLNLFEQLSGKKYLETITINKLKLLNCSFKNTQMSRFFQIFFFCCKCFLKDKAIMRVSTTKVIVFILN